MALLEWYYQRVERLQSAPSTFLEIDITIVGWFCLDYALLAYLSRGCSITTSSYVLCSICRNFSQSTQMKERQMFTSNLFH
jgi:hypothetical protein